LTGPDPSAVGVAYGRAIHLIADDAPHVLEDHLGIQLVDEATLAAARIPMSDGRIAAAPGDPRFEWRGTFIGRARFVEECVEASEVGQFVILGAGLDTFAWRRPAVMTRTTLFEVDEPATQAWKKSRLRDLGWDLAGGHRFVPVDFESAVSWRSALTDYGFDNEKPAIVVSTGVAQYITTDAFSVTLEDAAGLSPGTTFISTFVVPLDSTDVDERALRIETEKRNAARGTPWISSYEPDQVLALARGAGFDKVRHVAPSELNARYFAGRSDALRVRSGEHLFVASRTAG
jgi:methyltransferase (TIGR00027 family)